MRRILLFIFLTVWLASLCACSAANEEPPANSSSVQPADPGQTESASQESTVKQDITDYLTGLGYEVVNSKESKLMLEFMLTLSEFSDQDLSEPPENWDDISASFLEAESGASELSSDIPVVLYLQDNDGNNYLSVSGGEEKYNAFKTYSPGGFNPPTITLAEYNAISTGMTFQEVYDIIGGAGEVISEVDLGLGEEYHTVMRQWDGEGSFGASANVTFQGGKVTAKAQFGLE